MYAPMNRLNGLLDLGAAKKAAKTPPATPAVPGSGGVLGKGVVASRDATAEWRFYIVALRGLLQGLRTNKLPADAIQPNPPDLAGPAGLVAQANTLLSQVDAARKAAAYSGGGIKPAPPPPPTPPPHTSGPLPVPDAYANLNTVAPDQYQFVAGGLSTYAQLWATEHAMTPPPPAPPPQPPPSPGPTTPPVNISNTVSPGSGTPDTTGTVAATSPYYVTQPYSGGNSAASADPASIPAAGVTIPKWAWLVGGAILAVLMWNASRSRKS